MWIFWEITSNEVCEYFARWRRTAQITVPGMPEEEETFNDKKKVIVKLIESTEFTSRKQIELIDMQSISHNGFKWIMVYQYQYNTYKFCVLRSLTSKRATEVGSQLAYWIASNILRLSRPIIVLQVINSTNGRPILLTNVWVLVQYKWPRQNEWCSVVENWLCCWRNRRQCCCVNSTSGSRT